MSEHSQILQAIQSLDSGNSFWGRVSALFDKMEIAENEIAKAKERYPEDAERLHDCFKLMCPSAPLSDRPDKLYRAHCRELLERVHNNIDARPGTAAEVLAIMSTWSLEHMPDHNAVALMGRLFAQVFPEQDAYNDAPLEMWKGAADELYSKLQKKAAVDTRMF